MLVDVHRPAGPLDLRATLRPLAMGSADPTFRLDGSGLWRSTTTPHGSATMHVAPAAEEGPGALRVRAWGDGAPWMLETAGDLFGARDDWSGLDLSQHPPLNALRRRAPGLRLTRTRQVFAALVPAILGQKTTGRQARASWRRLVLEFGEPAPGPVPAGLTAPPTAAGWLAVPSWAWHRAGVQPAQSRTIVTAARSAHAIDALGDLPTGDPRIPAGLRAIRGIGEWTIAETVQRSHGDPDAISVGDYHLAKDVGWAMLGRPVDDPGMLELLEPWRGHRQRIVRLLEAVGPRRPRTAPRMSIQDHRGR